jgi:cob(I)alamin adenosyltransferase
MYTRAGDKGQTGLYGPKRVAKDSPRVEAYGTVDELNSCVGVAISSSGREEISEELRWVQGRLFVAGADLASERPAKGGQDRVPRVGSQDTKRLEAMIDRFQEKLPRLTSFILPGGTALSANLHLARSVCRRAERAVVSLAKKEDVNPELVPFLNRLSTYLFNAARYSNALEGVSDEVWVKD